jgi:glycosyltransferase involved in cell wall biosynthesis
MSYYTRKMERKTGVHMKTLVTIGICVRDSEKTIGNAIESVIRQDFPHDKIQIIIVDDGSKDCTPQILFDYASKIDIKTKIFQTKWRGLGPARNLILKNAEGDYIIWVDADEILTESYVRKQVEFMSENPKVGITVGLVKIVPKNLVLSLELIPAIINHVRYGKPKSFIWKTEKIPGTGGATFRVEALEQVGGFDEGLKGVGEDQDVAQRITAAGWLIRLNNAQFYEFHGGMATFKDLWRKYLWYGYGGQKIYRQNRTLFSFPRMSPLAGLLAGVVYSLTAYRLLRDKKVFLLPVHYSFKMTAWMLGFIKGQIKA